MREGHRKGQKKSCLKVSTDWLKCVGGGGFIQKWGASRLKIIIFVYNTKGR